MLRDPGDTGKVLIVGAGLAGLALAQGLSKASVEVSVYERDLSPDIRAQGYRLTLKDVGLNALQSCLPPALFELALATAIEPATRMIFMDEQLRPVFDKPIPSERRSGIGVNRLTLREILVSGLDDRLRFATEFHHYEHADAGRVRAVFADGSSSDGVLLVGADGTGSRVRSQLLPDAKVDEVGAALYGRTPLTPDTFDWLPDELVDSFNRATSADGTAMTVVTCRTSERPSDAAARLSPGTVLSDIPDYLSWTVSLPDDRARGVPVEQLTSLARATIAEWHPALRQVIDAAIAQSTFLVPIRTARPVGGWADSGVTLIGDAIHTMSPGRGDGANVALRDAQVLSTLLADETGDDTVERAKFQYESRMLEYGFAAVEASRRSPFAPPRA